VVAIALLTGAAYFLAARLSLILLTEPDGVAVFWPAAGISSGVLIALGQSARLPVAASVMVATALANMIGDRNLASSIVFAVCNAGEAITIAWLIERHFGSGFALDSLRRVLGFLLATLVGTAISGIGGTAGFILFHSSEAYLSATWLHWFTSDALGVVLVAPLVIGLAHSLADPPKMLELRDGLSSLLALVLVSAIGFGSPTDYWFTILPLALILPLLLLPAAHCRPVFAAAGAFIVGLTIVWTITFGIGRLGDVSLPLTSRVLAAQAALLALSACALTLSALFAERRESEAALKDSNDRLRLALDGAKLGVWSVDPKTGRFENDGRDRLIHGHDPVAPPKTLAEARPFIHPDDLQRLDAVFAASRRSGGSYNAEYRLAPVPGQAHINQERWVAVEGTVVRNIDGRTIRMLGVTRDITARKQTEGKLRKSEQASRELLAALPAAIYVTDAAGYISYCNQGAVELWGREPELGRDKWYDLGRFYYADGAPMPLSDCPTELALKQGQEVLGQECIIERRDGTRVPIIPYPMPLRDETGTIVGVINMTVDISERKQAEQALADRNVQLALAGRAALVGTYAYDVGADLMQVSEGYVAVHGLKEGTRESTRSQWRDRVFPDDLTRVDQMRGQAYRERWSEHAIEYRIIRGGGEKRWIESRSFISYSNGHPQRVVGVNIDVTQRKQAEQILAERDVQLDLAARIGRIGTFTIDYTTGIIQLSPGCANVYGLAEGTSTLPLDKGWSFVHPDDLPWLADLRSQVFHKEKSEFVAQFRIVRADNGEVRWLETRSLISYGKDGRPLRLVGASIDVTELRANEDHKSILLAELDHRVKNTLACVSAIALQTREDSWSMDDFLEAFNGRIHSLATTHALLSRSRWQAVGLAELIRNELAPCMKKDNTIVKGPDIYLSVEAAQTIAMVFHELATNAAKYGALSNGNGRVSVCWEKSSNGSSFDGLRFEWQETGGPTVLPPDACGYGTSVIRNLIPYELGGTVDYVFAPAGVRCTLQIPDKWLASRGS